MEASFCPYCGAPCRTREADVVYEEEEEEAESVISENWEENFPEEAEAVKEPECEEEAEAPAAEPGCEEEAEASERPECTEEAAAPVAAAEAQEEPAGGSGAQEEACEPEETI